MIDLETGVKGLYKIEAFRVDRDGQEIAGSRRVCADWFPNLITNAGMDMIGNSSNWLNACQVGTGASAPLPTDTALANRIGGTTTKQSTTGGAQSSAPYFVWRRNVYRFAAGVATGNISEVGISETASGNLFSRALIVDGSGTPTTITVLSDEVLDVSYEFRMYPPTSDYTGIITIAGVDYSVTGRASNVTTNAGSAGWTIGSTGEGSVIAGPSALNGSIGSITSSPSGASSTPTTTVNMSYSTGSYNRSSSATWGLNDGNLSGGIKSFRVKLGIGTYQFEMTPALPKDSTKTLTMVFNHSWARL